MREYDAGQARPGLADFIGRLRLGERITIDNWCEQVADLVPSAIRAATRTTKAIATINAMRASGIERVQFAERRRQGLR